MPLFVVIPLVVALLGGGTSLAAQRSLPGDFLYPVKVDVNERVANGFHLTSQAKADFEAALAVERLNEAERLAEQNKTVDASVSADLEARFKAYADRVEQKIADMKAKGNAKAAAEVADRFDAALKAHAEILARLASATSTENGVEGAASLTATVRGEADDVDKLKVDLETDENDNDKDENESEVRHATSTERQEKDDSGESETDVKLELGR